MTIFSRIYTSRHQYSTGTRTFCADLNEGHRKKRFGSGFECERNWKEVQKGRKSGCMMKTINNHVYILYID